MSRSPRARRPRGGTSDAPDVPGSPGRGPPLRDGTVQSVHGQWLRVRDDGGRVLRLKARHHLPALACGDRVQWQGSSGSGHVEVLQARHSLLSRPDAAGRPRPLVANIDQVVVVIAPRPSMPTGLLDRYLINIELQSLGALVVINKADLIESLDEAPVFAALHSHCTALGYAVLRCSSHTGEGMAALREQLRGRRSIMVGVSGAGKSSLAAVLVPGADIAVGALSENLAHGRHTTSSTRLLELPCGGSLVDSPGVRDFATWHIDSRALAAAFIEFRPLLGECRFRDCRHAADAGCAVRAAVRAGTLSESRYHSYLDMLAQSEATELARPGGPASD